MSSDLERNGPAARAQREGRPYGIRFRPHPFVVRIDEVGRPKTKLAPYGGVDHACHTCPSRCCSYRVDVSLPDALRMSRLLGVPVFTGLTIEANEHPSHAFRMDADPRWPADAWPGTAQLALRRVEAGHCHALVDLDGHKRCGIYSARPSLCRTYPIAWTSDVSEGGPPTVHCPLPYGVSDEHAAELERDIATQIDEWELHDDIVAQWNRGTGPFTIEAFLRFAVPLAATELGMSAPEAFVPGTPPERLLQQQREVGLSPRPPAALEPNTKPTVWAGLPRPILREGE